MNYRETIAIITLDDASKTIAQRYKAHKELKDNLRTLQASWTPLTEVTTIGNYGCYLVALTPENKNDVIKLGGPGTIVSYNDRSCEMVFEYGLVERLGTLKRISEDQAEEIGEYFVSHYDNSLWAIVR